MNRIQQILGTSVLFITTAGIALELAELSASVVKHAAKEMLGVVADVAQPLIVEAYGRVAAGIAQNQLEEKIENIFIPPEIRKSLENIDQAAEQSEEEKQNAQIEDLQRIFSKGEKKDPFRMDSLDLNIKKAK